MKPATVFGFETPGFEPTAGSHLGQPGLIVVTSSMRLRYINQRGKELCERINRSENTTPTNGLFPAAVRALAEELQRLIQISAESIDWKAFPIRRVAGQPDQVVQLLGTCWYDPDTKKSNILIVMQAKEKKEVLTMAATASKGKVIALEYTLTSEDNQVIDTNVGKDPLTYTQGSKEVIPGVESAVEGMTVGQTKQVVVAPAEGYGERDPNAVQEVPKEKVPEGVQVGTRLQGKDQAGRNISPTVRVIKDKTVLLDLNHPLAGKTLFFDLKVVNIT